MANWFFDGARADVAKVVSANPAFQLTHAFALGSASKPASYNFGAIFANAQVSSISCRIGLGAQGRQGIKRDYGQRIGQARKL